MSRYCLSLALLLLSLTSRAEQLSYAQLQRLTQSPAQLSGSFSQQKYLQALDISLLSSGVFEYQRGKVIQWETLQPIQNELIVTPTAIVSKQGGQNLLQLGAETNPAVAAFSGILFSVLTADWKKLANYFALSGQFEGNQWQAELVPLESTISQVVSKVELKGDVLLREVTLLENGGDRITIRFDHLKP